MPGSMHPAAYTLLLVPTKNEEMIKKKKKEKEKLKRKSGDILFRF